LKNLEKYQDSEDTDSKGKKPRREGLARKAMLKWVKHKQTKSDGAPAALDVTVRCLTFFLHLLHRMPFFFLFNNLSC
jgi:hypothetical protein